MCAMGKLKWLSAVAVFVVLAWGATGPLFGA